jgi:hypothetical protein
MKSQTTSRSFFLHSKSAFESKLPTLPEISVSDMRNTLTRASLGQGGPQRGFTMKSQTASQSFFLHSKSAFESKLPTLPEMQKASQK